jgi:ABC-2 type transport system ATP-binding protein
MTLDSNAIRKVAVNNNDEKEGNDIDVVVNVDNLVKVFNEKLRAVDDVSFKISRGEIFGFLGPNGAGKTTMIKMLTTLTKPTSGNAQIFGYDILIQAGDVRRAIGVVPQEYTADEDMTGYENIILCADLYGIPRSISKQRTEELLDLVELRDAAKRKVNTYSGGMRRRLELACGLINHPKLLFLDEPTLGLDVQTRSAIWRYIIKLKKGYGMTLFLTTHYLEEADKLCDRVAIIDHGKIVKIGSPAELKASVGGGIIELKLKEANADLGYLKSEVKSISGVEQLAPNDFLVRTDSSEEVAPAVLDAVRARGYHLTRISLKEPTLDDAYLKYTGRSMREDESDKWQTLAKRMTMSRARS